MSRQRAISALGGADEGLVTGLSWVPSEVLRAIAGSDETEDIAETLAAIALATGVDLAFVPADEPFALEAVRGLHTGDIAAVWVVDGVFSRVARDVGWSEALRLTAAEPGALSVRLDAALHDALVSTRTGLDGSADVVLVADDLAGPSGPLLSPDYVFDALVPCYHRLAVEIVSRGTLAAFHSDGDMRALMPALAHAGFSAVHLAGLAVDAIAEGAAAARSAGLVAIGGVGVQSLAKGARDVGERASGIALAIGGLIVCDDGGISDQIEIAAVGTALEAARDAYRLARG